MKIEKLRLIYYALSDEIRLKILKLIYDNEELCVCELQNILQISQPNLSFHLRILKGAGILKVKKEGKWNYYSINEKNEVLMANLTFIKSLKIKEKITKNICNIEEK